MRPDHCTALHAVRTSSGGCAKSWYRCYARCRAGLSNAPVDKPRAPRCYARRHGAKDARRELVGGVEDEEERGHPKAVDSRADVADLPYCRERINLCAIEGNVERDEQTLHTRQCEAENLWSSAALQLDSSHADDGAMVRGVQGKGCFHRTTRILQCHALLTSSGC